MELELEVINPELLPLGCLACFRFGRLGGLIGRGEECDWVIPDPERLLSTRHAMVRYEAGRFYIVDISTNGIYLNQDELPLTRELPVALHQGDCLQMGALLVRAQWRCLDQERASHNATSAVPLANPEDVTVRHPLPDETLYQPQPVAARSGKVQDRLVDEQINDIPADGSLLETPGTAPPKPDTLSTQQPARGDDSALLAAFCRGLGLPAEVFDRVSAEQVLEHAGSCLQVCFAGMLQLMQQRVQLKHRFRVDLTYVQHADNNPVKFSVSQKQLLRYFLKPEEGTFMPVDSGLQECFDDLLAHQAAVLAGAQQGLVQIFERLAPQTIAARVAAQPSRPRHFANRKAPLWDAFCAQHALLSDADDVFDQVFGGPFAQAYQQAVNQADSKATTAVGSCARSSAA